MFQECYKEIARGAFCQNFLYIEVERNNTCYIKALNCNEIEIMTKQSTSHNMT